MNDGAKIAVWDSTKGKIPVVLIHGFPENHECWNRILSEFPPQRLNDFRLILYDLRGFGESSKTGEASIERFYHDHQAVIAQLQLSSYHIVVHDWGGALALQVARFNAESLQSVAVMNTNFWKTDIFGMWHLIFLNIPLLPQLGFHWFPDKLFYIGIEKSFVEPRNLEYHAAQSYRKMFHDLEYSRYWIRLYRNMAKSIILQRFPFFESVFSNQEAKFPERSVSAYQTNFLLIWGKEDRFAPVWIGEDIRDNLIKRGASVTFKVLPLAGHFVQEEQPGLSMELLLQHWHSN